LRYVFALELGRGHCKPSRQFFDTSRAAAPEAATAFERIMVLAQIEVS
jgi:hypothetical protein